MIAEALTPVQSGQLSDAVLIATIGGVVTIVTSVVAAYFAYKAKKQSADNHAVVMETHAVATNTMKSMNGELTKWKEIAEKMYRQEGVLQEQSDERVRKEVIENKK